jgi:hypothetical protein
MSYFWPILGANVAFGRFLVLMSIFCPIFGANVTFERFLMPLNPKHLSDEHLSASFYGI